VRHPLTLALALGALALGGCNSDVSEDLGKALGPREAPKTRTFQADQRATFMAVKAAVAEMGYRAGKGGPAEGTLEALSPIQTGEDVGTSRQVRIRVELEPAAETGTDVTVSMTEIEEDENTNTPAMPTEVPLRDTPLYEVFFRNVQQALTAPKAGT
jgi:hypothetical protein